MKASDPALPRSALRSSLMFSTKFVDQFSFPPALSFSHRPPGRPPSYILPFTPDFPAMERCILPFGEKGLPVDAYIPFPGIKDHQIRRLPLRHRTFVCQTQDLCRTGSSSCSAISHRCEDPRSPPVPYRSALADVSRPTIPKAASAMEPLFFFPRVRRMICGDHIHDPLSQAPGAALPYLARLLKRRIHLVISVIFRDIIGTIRIK